MKELEALVESYGTRRVSEMLGLHIRTVQLYLKGRRIPVPVQKYLRILHSTQTDSSQPRGATD
jgi:hypothetical protein